MRARKLFVIASLPLLALGSACGVVSQHQAIKALPQQPSVTFVTDSQLEAALFEATNKERASHGLAPVVVDPELLAVARARAQKQIATAPLTHYDTDGGLVMQSLLDQAQVNYRLAGENLARVATERKTAAELADQALMDSPTHRANILEPTFDRLAVGAVTDPSGRVVFAQIFRAA